MKDFVFRLAFLTVFMIVIPLLIFLLSGNETNLNENINMIKIYDSKNDTTFELPFEEYVYGVVCAEMPAEFENEALKSQALAVRSYILYQSKSGTSKHPNAILCTDPTHCQAYCNENELKIKWGSNYGKYTKKIKSAVNQTKGQYIIYENKPINAVYHSCSNGLTENSDDVWGRNIEYLKSVESPGDELKRNYKSIVKINKNEFKSILENEIGTTLSNLDNPIGEISYTEGKNVKEIELYGFKFSSLDLRRIFNLNSTAFNIIDNGEEYVFTVCGSGHGVGLSQYGANYFAKCGMKCEDIIKHYYPNTQVCTVDEN